MDICGPQVVAKLLPVWGLDQEGELNSVWKESGHEGIWLGLGLFGWPTDGFMLMHSL